MNEEERLRRLEESMIRTESHIERLTTAVEALAKQQKDISLLMQRVQTLDTDWKDSKSRMWKAVEDNKMKVNTMEVEVARSCTAAKDEAKTVAKEATVIATKPIYWVLGILVIIQMAFDAHIEVQVSENRAEISKSHNDLKMLIIRSFEKSK